MQEIIVTISKNNETKVEVKGIKGKGCLALTKEFEEKLGNKISDVPTSEMHEPERQQVRH